MKNFVLFFLLSFSIEGVFGETVSVIDGDSVTLHTGLTKIQEDDVLEWRFGAGHVRIVRARKDSDPKYDDVLGGRFRDRLKLDRQTGDLTITNITTEHAGLYEISINAIALRTFTVNGVSGVDEVKSVTVGDSVTLNSGTNIQRDDVIQWRFADQNSPIAEHNRKTGHFSTSDGPDGRFRDRLQLDYLTGSLTIRNIGTKHSGLYEAVIRKSSSGYTIHQSYSVTARGERKPALVTKGDNVTLHTDLTEIHTDDFILWMFEDSVIAEINKAQNQLSISDDVLDGRFRDRLKLDEKTGNLTITHTTTEDSGLYELKIISSRFTINKRITVIVSGLSAGEIAGIVFGVLLAFAVAAVVAATVVIYYRHKISELKELKRVAVIEGDSVTITPYRTEIHKDDDILWIFGGALIAERKGLDLKVTVYDDVLDKKFKDRLKLDKDSGYLTIHDIKTTHSGRYELWSGRLGNKSLKTLRVSVFEKAAIEKKSVKEGESVTLQTGYTDVQKDEQIVWKFGLDDSPIAQITDGAKKISRFGAGWRFRGRLELNNQTGSLTITKIKPLDAGFYVLYIFKSRKTSNKKIRVEVSDPTDNRNNPEDVPLRSVEAS